MPLSPEMIQREDDQTRRLGDAAAGLLTLKIQRILAGISEEIDQDRLEEILEARNNFLVMETIPTDKLENKLIGTFDDITTLHNMAAQAAMSNEVPGSVYDQLDPNSVDKLRQGRTRLVNTIRDGVYTTVAWVLSNALMRRLTAKATVLEVTLVVGLTPQQAQAVLNYRKALEAGNVKDAISRMGRDVHYDVATRGMSETPLKETRITTMVRKYAERMRKSRAQTIARTEAANAAALGKRAGYSQLVKSGEIATLRRFWLTAQDELVCKICATIPLMNLDGVPLGGVYMTPNGTLPGPGAHPNCRCSERIEARRF